MSIPVQQSLHGFIVTDPQLNFSDNGVARFYACVGVEHFRKETDGSFTPLEPTFHDLVLFRRSAERAYDRFRKGDSFVASGYVHEYDIERDGKTVPREEFVGRRIGHDLARTRYAVERRQSETMELAQQRTPDAARPAVRP